MRRGVLASVLLIAALFLSACTGFQTSGGVSAGRTIQERAPIPAVYDPDGPVAGATPDDIVAGFLAASIAPEESWAKAKTFLSGDYQQEWNPRAATTVYSVYQFAVDAVDGSVPTPTPAANQTSATVKIGVTATADISQNGVYAATAASSQRDVVFQLTKKDGQWRITAGPPGLLINTPGFEQIYSAYNLAFYDSSYSFLVPETRWYPRATAVRDVVGGLLDGASEWLAPAVRTAVPEGARSLASIPVEDSTATIRLSGIDKLDDTALGRLRLQLLESLKNTTVSSINLFSEMREITAPAANVVVPTANQRALVMTDAGLGFRSTDTFDALDPFATSMHDLQPQALEVSPTAGHGVVQDSNGTVYRIGAGTERQLVERQQGLIAPTIGPYGDIWTVPGAKPSDLKATLPGGEAAQFPAGLAPLSSIVAMQLSRDGTRLAVVGADGSDNVLYVFAVQRDATGKPTGIGSGLKVRDLRSSPATSLAWLSPLTIALVVPRDNDTSFVVQPVGAPAGTSPAPIAKKIVSIAGTSDATNRWVLASDGTLYASRGASWTSVAAGIHVLARQQGPAAVKK